MALKDLQNLILNGSIISGGVSIVARVQAWRAWRRFKAALGKAHTLDAGDRLYQPTGISGIGMVLGCGRLSSRSFAPSCGSFPSCSTYDPPRAIGGRRIAWVLRGAALCGPVRFLIGQIVIREPTSTARSSGMQNWSVTSLAERAIGMKM